MREETFLLRAGFAGVGLMWFAYLAPTQAVDEVMYYVGEAVAFTVLLLCGVIYANSQVRQFRQPRR